MAVLPAGQDGLLRAILSENNIKRQVKRVDIKVPEMDGDHFSSSVEFWTIHFGDDGDPLDLFVKKSVANEKYAAELREMEMFEKEAGFFKAIYPDMAKLLTEKGGNSKFLDESLPKCYHADKDVIVLENIAKKGYEMVDKMIPHNFEQARKLLRILAGLHGTSYALIETIGLENCLERYPFLRVATLWTESGMTLNGSFLMGVSGGSLKILEECPVPGSEEVLEFVKQYQGKEGFSKIGKLYDLNDPGVCGNVLNHGDCWGVNVMWTRNPETNETEKCLLIDFQTVHVGSPALDLLYYMFFTVDAKTRREQWKNLLQEYYDTFKSYSQTCGVKLKFSLEDLVNDYRSKLEVGFFLGMFAIFGMEGVGEMKDVDKIEGDMGTYFTSTIVDTVEKNLATKGKQYAEELVEAYKEYLEIKDDN